MRIGIIGGGAAGMMAAVWTAGEGREVHLFERNGRLGRKLFLTGKGRCNVTNDCSAEEFFANVVTNSKFLYSCARAFDSRAASSFFEESGVPLKVERGNRVFPVSDHSSDVIRALERRMRQAGVRIHTDARVRQVLTGDGAVRGLLLEDGTRLPFDLVLIACGGRSYPTTGSDGDGSRLAEELGHTVRPARPALVPLCVEEPYVRELQGLSLRNVTLRIPLGKKVFEAFGELLFTHFGISGPITLTASSRIGGELEEHPLEAFIDLKPALSDEQLDARLVREFAAGKNRQFRNVLPALFPPKLQPVMAALSGIDPTRPVNGISREERQRFARLIRALPLTITGTRGWSEAIITQGGVEVKEVRPGTMESRKVAGLFFAGEVLDVDALTGGFNLQIAWATAYAAAAGMKKRTEQR